MEQPDQDDLADTVGTDVPRSTLIREIVAKVDGFDAAADDDELDRWWGVVEVDRLASGLTLATIARLSTPDDQEESGGPWLIKTDEAGDEPTQLTPEGRTALRSLGN